MTSHMGMLRPIEEPHYPVPWRVAETRDRYTVIVCAAGHYTAEAPTPEAAQLIVDAVNAYAEGLGIAVDTESSP